MGLAARVPIGPLTPRDIDSVLRELPAQERAALEWAAPKVEQAIKLLHEGPLTEPDILRAAAMYASAIRPFAEMGAAMAAEEPVAFGGAIQDRLQKLGPKVREYLGATEHAARLERTLSAMFIVGALAMREIAELNVGSSEGTGMRASVLVIAVLEAVERGVPVERVRALIDRADLEGWVIARGLASTTAPGGPISVPGYPMSTASAPPFRTELARKLWEQRQRVVAESGTLTDAEVEAELAARRGGVEAGC